MIGKYCSLNGKLTKTKKAVLPIDHIEFAYGFGVYENLRMRKGFVYHIEEHIKRLFDSAKIIDLNHDLDFKQVKNWVEKLIEKNNIKNGNIKMILIGGKKPILYIFMLPPKYIEKKEYRQGIKVTTYNYERFAPQAKALNMLPSYIIFKRAQKENAYDALLIDRDGNIIEGTRSNFFAIKNKTLTTPPLSEVLDGVTRRTVIECAKQNGYNIKEENIPLKNIFDYDGAFLTNTSGKIMPVKTIDEKSFDIIPDNLQTLRKLYDNHISHKE
ncbi:hypothetical protein HOF40_01215 [Candidatus Parcubacteria bacterium]|jgi:branched-chain amino acid aminotransferase|nr:hypothetical protein [Candidatus Parcubacteria bacterium]MBT3948686.1 hypothetical protein [Candidatus Parcubacteria bacterium]